MGNNAYTAPEVMLCDNNIGQRPSEGGSVLWSFRDRAYTSTLPSGDSVSVGSDGDLIGM